MNYDNIKTALDYIKTITDFVPKVSIVLGSGLGALADEIDVIASIKYNDIPNFPVSTVEGHKGRFVLGYINNVPVAIMQGRVHYYEGYTMEQVVMPIRILREMGSEILLLTNAAGGVNFTFNAGDFMVIRDHISSLVPSPLIGVNYEKGQRFPDMSNVYNAELSDIITNCGVKLGIPMKQGVYIQLSGPNYETPAEVRMCRILGADAVGMSTACEAMAAVHCGFRVCGISCISNLACGMTANPLNHKEVQEISNKKSPIFKALIKECVKEFAKI